MSDYELSPQVIEVLGPAAGQFRTRERHPEACCWRCDGPFSATEAAEVVVLRSTVDGHRVLRVVLSHRACGRSAVLDDPGTPQRRRELPSVTLVPFQRVAAPRAGMFVDHLVEVSGVARMSDATIDVRTTTWLDGGFGRVAVSTDIVWGTWEPIVDWWAAISGGRVRIGRGPVTLVDAEVVTPDGWAASARSGGLLVVSGSFRFPTGTTVPDPDLVAAAVRSGRVAAGAVTVDESKEPVTPP